MHASGTCAFPFVCCLLALGVSAISLDTSESYQYIQGLDPMESQNLGEGTCKICSEGSQCFILNDPSRCEYYAEAFQLMQEDEDHQEASPDPELRAEIDDMLYILTEKALEDPRYHDCVPFVSEYTDCTKDNICTGCRRCSCDTRGTWNCTRVQHCRPDAPKLKVDRRTLITVIEALKNINTGSRTKRSLTFNEKPVLYKDVLSYEKMGEWMYGVLLANSGEVKSNATASTSEINKSNGVTNSTEVTSSTEKISTSDVTSETKVNYETIMNKAKEASNATEAFTIEISNVTEVNDGFKIATGTEETYASEATNALVVINTMDIANQTEVSNATKLSTGAKLPNTVDVNNLNIMINFTIEPDERIDVLSKDMIQTNETELSKISFNEITEWLNEVHPLITNKRVQTKEGDASIVMTSEIVVTTPPNDANSTIANIVSSVMKSDNEIIAFDEVLRSIAVNSKNYTRRKPPSDMERNKITADQDIRNYYNENITVRANNDDQNLYENILSAVEIRDSVTENFIINMNETREYKTEPNTIGVTEIVIDLLESAKVKDELNNEKGSALVDYIDSGSKLTNDVSISFENANYAVLNTLNIMKRDVSHFQENNTEVTTAKADNCTHTFQDLNDNVLSPLNNILRDKQKEVEELLKIRENLIALMRTYEDFNIDTDSNGNKTEPGKNTNSFFSIYKLEIVPHFDHDFRRSNTTLLDKYLLKLKRDVNEVIRDIVHIQELSDKSKLSEGLKFLIRAMKVYVHKQGFHTKHKRNHDIKAAYRRNWKPESVSSLYTLTTQDDLIKIFEEIGKKISHTNGLNPLSYKAKKIINRIIKQNYVEEYSVTGLKILDPHYNLTNDLRNIGTKWHEKTNDISNCSPPDQLYCTKLLYLLLSTDFSKMNDALALIDFARSRRMLPVEEDLGKELVMKLNMDLRNIHKTILGAMKNKSKPNPNTVPRLRNDNVKESFMKQLKNILKKSKNDILRLLHKQVPKSDVIRMLARKKLNNLTETKYSNFKKTMLKWQDNLNVLPLRGKRSVSYYYNNMGNRVRTILPKYLRRKVNPGMAKSSRGNVKTYHSTDYKRKNTKTTATRVSTYKNTTESL